MKLEISGNNVTTKGKYVQGIVYKEHAMLPSAESFVIFETEEQQQIAIDIINQFSNITLKYKNMITVDEAASIADNTEFCVLYQNNVKFINFIETLIYYQGQTNTSYILDLTILKYFKNVKIFQVYSMLWSHSPTKIIIDMSNIEEIKKTINGINTILLNTDKVTHIYASGFSGFISDMVSFPSLEILDAASFTGANIKYVKNLGKITEIKNNTFNGCNCIEVCLPPTCKTLKSWSFYNCTIHKISGTDYIETFDSFYIIYGVSQLKTLSFKNLTTIISSNNYIISSCSQLEEITSLGKLTEFPRNFLYQLYNLKYLDIPETLRTLNENCISLSNAFGNSYYHIQNTLDFSRVTTIIGGNPIITNTKGTTIIWPETCTNTKKAPFMSNCDFKNIINIRYWLGSYNSYSIIDTLTITNYENEVGPYISANVGFSTNDDIGTVVMPLSFMIQSPLLVKNLTIKTEYITNIHGSSSITVYQELNLDDNIESIYNINFYGTTLRLPSNLKYIRNFTAPNLKYIEYPQNILLKYISQSFNQFSATNPYNRNHIIPSEYYEYSYQNGYYNDNSTIFQFSEGVKGVAYSFNGTFPNVQSFIIPSSMVKCESSTFYMSNINTLTILSDNFTFKYINITGLPIKQFNISNTCETLNILSSSIYFSPDILEFPATMTDFFSNSMVINAQSSLRKIIFNGSTYINADPTLQSSYGSYFSYIGNPNTVKEIINVYLPFFYNNRSMFMNIEKITIADNMDNSTILYTSIFNNYKKLKFVKLPNTLKIIEAGAFYDNVQLSELDIPDTIEYISNYAFGYCSSLRTMIIRATTPPESESANIKHVTELCTIYVPEESVTAYKESPYWIANAAQIQAIPEE